MKLLTYSFALLSTALLLCNAGPKADNPMEKHAFHGSPSSLEEPSEAVVLAESTDEPIEPMETVVYDPSTGAASHIKVPSLKGKEGNLRAFQRETLGAFRGKSQGFL